MLRLECHGLSAFYNIDEGGDGCHGEYNKEPPEEQKQISVVAIYRMQKENTYIWNTTSFNKMLLGLSCRDGGWGDGCPNPSPEQSKVQ